MPSKFGTHYIHKSMKTALHIGLQHMYVLYTFTGCITSHLLVAEMVHGSGMSNPVAG